MYSIPDSKAHIQQYEPGRVSPIYTYIAKKYNCVEDVVKAENAEPAFVDLNSLTFNIKENDPSMVWKSVRLCLPISCEARDEFDRVSMRISDSLPACNVAIAANWMEMFSSIDLICNGSIFASQPNRYQGMLDRVYRGRDVLSFQSGGSLKPIVNRNLKQSTEANSIFPVIIDHDDEKAEYVQVHDTLSSVSRNAFDLTQSNAGFITRSAAFQQSLKGQTYLKDGLASMYVDIGIFQGKERKLPSGRRLYNDACPYLRDVTLRFTFDKLRSKFDAKHNTEINEDFQFFQSRDFPSKLLEFATPVNSSIYGETALPVAGWAKNFNVYFTAKPYLEVQFVQLPEQVMQDKYSLMAIRHQHETSDIFHLSFPPPGDNGILQGNSVYQRVNSRLLEVPSRIYLWAGLSFNDKKSFFLGNTGNQRFCEITDLHLRMNTRTDALFNPTQLECYNVFKRLSLNDMNYQTWSKSPIYCWDPQSLGQPEFKASDGQLMTYDWTCQIRATALQYEEMISLQNSINQKSMGYNDNDVFEDTYMTQINNIQCPTYVHKYQNWIPNVGYVEPNDNNLWAHPTNLIPNASRHVGTNRAQCFLAHYIERPFVSGQHQLKEMALFSQPDEADIMTSRTQGRYVKRKDGQAAFDGNVHDNPEIWRIHQTLEHYYRFDNFIWAIWDATNNRVAKLANSDQLCLWWVPESWPMILTTDDLGYTDPDSGNYGIYKTFNDIGDLSFNANGEINFTAGNVPIFENDHTQRGVLRGRVIMQDTDGTVVTRDFNKVTAALKGQYCPGPRALPMIIQAAGANRAISGIRNVGQKDGGRGGAQTNRRLRGGLRPEDWVAVPAGGNNAAVDNQTFFKMINPILTAGHPNQPY